LSALVDELLAVLDLGLGAAKFLKVFTVDVLELFDFLDFQIFLFADDDLAVLVVRRSFIDTVHCYIRVSPLTMVETICARTCVVNQLQHTVFQQRGLFVIIYYVTLSIDCSQGRFKGEIRGPSKNSAPPVAPK